jgi:hypothetical protein
MTEQELLSKLSIQQGSYGCQLVMFDGSMDIAIEEFIGSKMMRLDFDSRYIYDSDGKDVSKYIQKYAWAIIKWIQEQGFKVVVYA